MRYCVLICLMFGASFAAETEAPIVCDDPNEEYNDEAETCDCRPGMERDIDDKCIPEIESALRVTCVGQHIIFKACGTACPRTCNNRNTPLVCSAQCVLGCFCKKGYIFNYSGRCVLPKNCECKVNEIYTTCGSCDGTCRNPFPICPAVCLTGCFCRPGYVRRNSVCVPRAQCPAA